MTTPTLLVALTRNEAGGPATARPLLDEMRAARSWTNNSYVDWAETVLDTADG